MRLVTDDAARLAQGEPVLGDTQPELSSGAEGVSVTLGLGHSLFERLGLSHAVPACFPVLPAFATDAFEPSWSGTDLLIQVGAEDPVVLSHALRLLDRDLSTLTRRRWIQRGFRSPEPALPGSPATRNLMGQVDGTVNPRGDALGDVVWIGDGASWVRGGTVLVLRRIRMLLDDWDLLDRAVQESVIGRRLDTGAPLGGVGETDVVPLDAVDDLGLPVIPHDAHVRVAHAPSADTGILRRPYNYDDGDRDGVPDVGLLFAAYAKDPTRSYIPMQRRIADSDAFNRWNTTVGSSTYLIPAGAAEGRALADGLFA
jgi:dye decolorizing peroxidase